MDVQDKCNKTYDKAYYEEGLYIPNKDTVYYNDSSIIKPN